MLHGKQELMLGERQANCIANKKLEEEARCGCPCW